MKDEKGIELWKHNIISGQVSQSHTNLLEMVTAYQLCDIKEFNIKKLRSTSVKMGISIPTSMDYYENST